MEAAVENEGESERLADLSEQARRAREAQLRREREEGEQKRRAEMAAKRSLLRERRAALRATAQRNGHKLGRFTLTLGAACKRCSKLFGQVPVQDGGAETHHQVPPNERCTAPRAAKQAATSAKRYPADMPDHGPRVKKPKDDGGAPPRKGKGPR